MGIVENEKIARVTPEEITQFASGHLTGVDVDLVFVSCTNFRAIDVIPELQRKLRVPVCTSNQAAFDAVSDLLGLDIGSVPSVA
jgi:maleate isomerase